MFSTHPVGRERGGGGRGRSGRAAPRSAGQSAALALAACAGVSYPALSGAGLLEAERTAAALVGWTAIALGLLLRRLPMVRLPPGSRRAAMAGGALIAWTALGLLWTESTGRTVDEVARLLALGILPAAVWLYAGPRSWRPLAWGVLAALFAVPVLAVVARLAPDLFGAAPPDLGVGFRRLAFPLGYWNALGIWSAAAAAAAVLLGSQAGGVRVRAVILATVPFAVLAVYLSYSRAATVLLLAGIATAIVAAGVERRTMLRTLGVAALSAPPVLVVRARPEIADATGTEGAVLVGVVLLAAAAGCAVIGAWSRRLPAHTAPLARVVGLSAVLAVVVVVVAGSASDVATPAESRPGGQDPAVRLLQLDSDRYSLWASALRAFEAEPLHGIGPGAFALWWSREPSTEREIANAHSLPLEALAELGLPGLALLAAFLALLFAAGLRGGESVRSRGARAQQRALLIVFAIVIAGASVDWLVESGAIVAMALACVTLAAAPAANERKGRPRFGRRAAALSVGAVAAALLQAPGSVGSVAEERSLRAFERDDFRFALEQAERAVDARPWAATPYVDRAVALAALGELDAARADAMAAIERERGDWRHLVLLARIERAAGNESEARAASVAAERLRAGEAPVAPP